MNTLILRTLILFGLLAALAPARQAAPAAHPGTIAYSRIDTPAGTEIRLVEPDGSGDRLLTTLPKSPTDSIPALAWRPDSTALALSSDHGATTSLFEQDIYTIRPDGKGLQRLTNGPAPGQLGGYPKGTVTVDVVMGTSAAGPLIVYVAGAASPQSVVASGRLTFTDVADLGPGVVQGVVGMVGPKRWYSVGADVEAGKVVRAATLIASGSAPARRAFSPSWRHDGQAVGFVAGESCGEFRSVPAAPVPHAQGLTVARATAPLGLLCLADWGATAATAGRLLYSEVDHQTRGVYLKQGDEPARLLFTYSVFRLLVDLKWLPDGSGFIVSFLEYEGGRWAAGNLHEFSFATGRLRQITAFADELTGNLSVSPDAQWLVFERAASLEDYTDLWLVRRDGSDMRLLARKASRPAWSQGAPTVPPTYDVFLPMIRG